MCRRQEARQVAGGGQAGLESVAVAAGHQCGGRRSTCSLRLAGSGSCSEANNDQPCEDLI